MKPFHTEFAVFQKRSISDVDATSPSGDGKSGLDEVDLTPPEVFCSRLTRLYGKNGTLKQATSAFFSIDRRAM